MYPVECHSLHTLWEIDLIKSCTYRAKYAVGDQGLPLVPAVGSSPCHIYVVNGTVTSCVVASINIITIIPEVSRLHNWTLQCSAVLLPSFT